jgi:hypothetical protein
MPDGPFPTPDEERLMRMLHQSGSPEAAGAMLVARLAALEAAVASLEADVREADPDPEPQPEADQAAE